ncbi:MAG: hypothetical protein RL577_1530, partial [Bacteroidota bacterium]
MKHWLLFFGFLLGFGSNVHAQKHVDANAYTQNPADYNNQVVKISNIILIKPSSSDEFYSFQFRDCPNGYTPISIQFPDLGYRGRFMIHQN